MSSFLVGCGPTLTLCCPGPEHCARKWEPSVIIIHMYICIYIVRLLCVLPKYGGT